MAQEGEDLIHAPALERIATSKISGEQYAASFKKLAGMAKDSCAASADFALRFVANAEEVDAQYVPVIILRVEPPTQE